MKFANHLQLKHAIKCHAVANGLVIKYLKSESNRLLAVCGQPNTCRWRLWATQMSTEESFQIKTLRNKHTCVRDYNAKIVTSIWLAKEYARKLRDNPTMKLKEMMADVKETYGITVTLNQCYRAKEKAVGEIEKDLEKHYGLLFNYAEEIQSKNPGSRVVIDVNDQDGARKFRRFYVCFAGIKRGWKENCRKIIGLDGCWLKGKCKGELLSAIGRDANDQMFPICWAVVEGESYDSWSWFLKLLVLDLGPDGPFSKGTGWTILSDQQKGLIKAVGEIMPEAEHRNCARHIYANFKKKWDGAQYRKWFWVAAKSSTKAEFGKAMSSILTLSKNAHKWLMIHDPNVWSRAFFSTTTKCTNIENNMCEVFNGSILSARDKLIIHLLEDIRRALMDRKERNSAIVLANDSDPICPRIRKKLEDHKQVYRYWNLKYNGEGMFEVYIGPTCGYVVNMKEGTCTCNMWKLSGIPCVHAISAIYYGNGNPDDYVDACYMKETYRQTYSGYLQPMEGSNMWPESSINPVLPPVERRMPGRPKKARRKEFGEDVGTSKKQCEETMRVSRKKLQMTCSNCGGSGHNKKTCKNPTKVVNSQPKKNRGRPKVEKPTTSVAPKKRQVKKYTNMGAGLYIDLKTGKTYLNGFLIQSGQAPSHGGESSNPATVILSQDGPSATQSNEME
nr:PREDICTED: uncharacterized protein LOC108217466 [Daucus carota subsp. sativus]